MKVEFSALVKGFSSKALLSLDKSFEARLQGIDPEMMKLAAAPADREVKITIEWLEN